MSKIGLITIYHVSNYGSVLQCFATQQVLMNLGHECNVIKYKFPNEWHFKNGFKRQNVIKSAIRFFFPKKKDRLLDLFRANFFNYTKCYKSLEELKSEDWKDYDNFVVGSDQVWNTRFLLGDEAFLLSFVPRDKKRYSIASSFALDVLPNKYRDKFRVELSKFEAISVREDNAVKIISNDLLINKPVSVVLDPTLLLSKEDWLRTIPRSKFKKNHPYILFYMWAYAFEPRPYIYEVTEYFQKKLSCDIIVLEGCMPQLNNLKIINKSESSVAEFIDLFYGAELVITSSFHGTAFALNFGIPLISIVPNNNGDDRQSSLIKKLGVENCIARIGQNIETLNPYYDINKEQLLLSNLRNSSLHWISKNIK